GPGRYSSKASDFFHLNDYDPLHESMNPILLSEFVTGLGKIKSRALTDLTWRSQRRVSKAIRRARAIGVMPSYWKDSPRFRRAS
ncbi:ribosomal protein S18, partial [Vararia minispora EC-137]